MVESAKPGVNFEAHLQEGELRTSRDVLDWLDEYDAAEQLGDVRSELRKQLRRERRQACRRGSLEAWRTISRFLRRHQLPLLGVGDPIPQSFRPFITLQFGSHSPDGHLWRTAEEVYAWIYGAFERALAFRAAARLK